MTTIEVYRSSAYEGWGWYWRARAGNHQIIATGAESYTLKWSAKRAARRSFPGANLVVIR